MTRFARGVDAALLAGVLLAVACPAPRPPAAPSDELEALRLVVDQIEAAAPAAWLACSLVPDPDQRRYCEGGLEALGEVVAVGRPLLESAEACRAGADLECLDNARATARELLRKARSLRGEDRGQGGSPAPSSS